jgi:monoamine oxidase
MTREEFLRLSALLGLGTVALPSLVTSCSKEEELTVNFSGKVLIIGAGAAGMMAAYTLYQHGIDFEIIEAMDRFGGRVKQTTTLADFPIDIGAEWIHHQPSIFSQLINDKNVEGSVDMIPYQLEEFYSYDNGTMSRHNYASTFYGEYKFKSSTWYQFFEAYIVPHIMDRMHLSSPVDTIDYAGDKMIVTDTNTNTYEGDKVIVTVPLNVLKSELITFAPALPSEKLAAINKTDMPDGLKVFIRFSEKFYPDIVLMGGLISGSDAEKIYYDAAFKKDTNDHVLALFSVGPETKSLVDLGSDQAIFDFVLAELNEMFDGKASQYYVDHVVQNWSAEPYVQGSYSFGGDDYYTTIGTISDPVEGKVYFAGEALHEDYWATVHGAGLSGRGEAEKIITGG